MTNHSDKNNPITATSHTSSSVSSIEDAIVNYDPKSLSNAKANWYFGEWEELTKIDLPSINGHPDFALLAAFKASGYQQLDDIDNCKKHVAIAKSAGCDVKVIAKLLITGVHNTLGKLAALKNDEDKAIEHFKAAVDVGEEKDTKLARHARSVKEIAKLGLLPQAAKLVDAERKSLESNSLSASERDAKLKVLATEMQLINHELSLAHQKNQLYSITNEVSSIYNADGTINKKQLEKLSPSQLGQDLWVLEQTNYKKGGFFVEFGATDGVLLSNTYLLEKEFGWKGLCAEPNPKFYENLKKNRSCITSPACIANKTGDKVNFVLADEYGGIESSALEGMHKDKVKAFKSEKSNCIELETISLHDFLVKNNAPKKIDYLSIDTEGSEFEIIKDFPFDEWDVKCLTVEHNFEPQRERINELLAKCGYKRTEVQWDDWYSREENNLLGRELKG